MLISQARGCRGEKDQTRVMHNDQETRFTAWKKRDGSRVRGSDPERQLFHQALQKRGRSDAVSAEEQI